MWTEGVNNCLVAVTLEPLNRHLVTRNIWIGGKNHAGRGGERRSALRWAGGQANLLDVHVDVRKHHHRLSVVVRLGSLETRQQPAAKRSRRERPRPSVRWLEDADSSQPSSPPSSPTFSVHGEEGE